MRSHALLALCLLLTRPLAAQESNAPSRGPDGETRYLVEGIKVLPLAGKPFSGRSTTEWTRTLEDGTVVTTRLYAMVARDSQGRIYREKRKFVPSNSDQQSRLTAVLIFDPLTHTRTECNLRARHCSVTGYHAPPSFTLRPVGPFDDGKRLLARESLGSDVIDGIEVTGMRETISISAGAVGNSQPLVSTREFWYSPDLQVNLAVIRKDPREGTEEIRVHEVSRSEPDPSLFRVPANFVVKGEHGAAKAED